MGGRNEKEERIKTKNEIGKLKEVGADGRRRKGKTQEETIVQKKENGRAKIKTCLNDLGRETSKT